MDGYFLLIHEVLPVEMKAVKNKETDIGVLESTLLVNTQGSKW